MRGKRCAGLRVALLTVALWGAGAAALAKDAPTKAPDPGLPATIIVLDASSSMNEKIGGASKITAVRTELGTAIGSYERPPFVRSRRFRPSQGGELCR